MKRFAVAWLSVLLLAVALIGTSRLHGRVAAQGTPFDCSGIVFNGGFERPEVIVDTFNGAEGWGGKYTLEIHLGHFRSGSQSAMVYVPRPTVSQTLDTSALVAGDVITISFWNIGGITASLNSASVTSTTDYKFVNGTVSYTLLSDAEPVVLTFTYASYFDAAVDDVSASCVGADPTPTVTNTPVPTIEPTATEVPPGAIDLTVTGDPRFPVAGSAALDTQGLTYTLVDMPNQGSVVVNPDGTFTYLAASVRVTTDQFTIRASDGTLITVNVVLAIDPGVSTYGEVGPGGTGNGGPVEDARDPGQAVPEPTSAPDGDHPVEAR